MGQRYYVHDLETNKLHIHTGGKADWKSLPQKDQDEIKRACLWSSKRGCWVSRALMPKALYWLRDVLARTGFEDRGQEGEKLAFAEQVASVQERAEERLERMEARADRAEVEADRRFNSSNVQAVRDLQGEPVKIGHHSQRRHERLLEKADNDMDKGCQAMKKRDHYRRRAETAQDTADGQKYSDPAYLNRRIEECQKELRLIERRLQEINAKKHGTGPDTVDWMWNLMAAQEEENDKLGFFQQCLEDCGKKVWDKESLKGKTHVLLRGRWEEIVKLNPKTVAIPNICFPDPDSQRKWALKYAYAEVRDAR
jgi:hypothetical protein